MLEKTKAKWLEHVTKWRASGLSYRDYAERAGLNHRTFAWYASILRDDAAPSVTSDFVELAPVEVTMTERIELVVDDFIIRLPSTFEPATLTRLLDVLEACR